ncbi:MAG: GNAT family N-acetyltransferase [Longimicrobiaceae bacterium]
MTAIHFRRAVPADAARVARLRREGEAGGDPPERMARYLAGEHHPQQALPPRAMWIAEEDGGEPAGYVAGHLTRRFGCDGELQWIYVVADRRRSGLGREMVGLMARWFVENGARRVCVNVGDEAARPFYRHCGAVDLRPHWMVWDDVGRVLEAPLTPGPSSQPRGDGQRGRKRRRAGLSEYTPPITDGIHT